MSRLGRVLARCKVSDKEYESELKKLIKLDKSGRLRIIKGSCKDCSWFYEGFVMSEDGVMLGKCMLAMTAVRPNEYCSKYKK